MADINDEELFNSAMTDEVPEVETPEAPEVEPEGQPRDEQGRFAARAEANPDADVGTPNNAPPDQAAQQREEANVPSWRLREVREEGDRRVAEVEARMQRQIDDMRRQNQPRPEPTPAPDVFENPNAFLQHGVSQAVDPIKSEIQELREFYSWQNAVREHTIEKAKAARDAFAKAVNDGDPEARAVLQSSMRSMDPFGTIIAWHQQKSVFQQIGNDPEKWFGQTLEQRLASDPKFAGELLQKIQNSARGQPANPQGQAPRISLAPSLNRVPSARSATDDDDNDDSSGAMFNYATR